MPILYLPPIRHYPPLSPPLIFPGDPANKIPGIILASLVCIQKERERESEWTGGKLLLDLRVDIMQMVLVVKQDKNKTDTNERTRLANSKMNLYVFFFAKQRQRRTKSDLWIDKRERCHVYSRLVWSRCEP